MTEYTTIRISFDPYSHQDVQKYVRQVYRDFGRDQTRWFYRSANIDDIKENCWELDFVFRDPKDATLFALKYLRWNTTFKNLIVGIAITIGFNTTLVSLKPCIWIRAHWTLLGYKSGVFKPGAGVPKFVFGQIYIVIIPIELPWCGYLVVSYDNYTQTCLKSVTQIGVGPMVSMVTWESI